MTLWRVILALHSGCPRTASLLDTELTATWLESDGVTCLPLGDLRCPGDLRDILPAGTRWDPGVTSTRDRHEPRDPKSPERTR